MSYIYLYIYICFNSSNQDIKAMYFSNTSQLKAKELS